MRDRVESSGAACWTDVDGTEAIQCSRALVDGVGDGTYQFDAEDRFVAVNDAIVETTGYAREEPLDERVSVLLDDDDSTVERAVERLDGDSWAESESGERATFTVAAQGERDE